LPPAEEAQLREHAAECPACGPRLALIEQAEAWLAGQAGAPKDQGATGECPPAEELYDYGRGPGARPLPSSRERAVRNHVEACGECAGLVATLASRPPVPLWIDVPASASAAAPVPLLRPRHWMSFALAAAAVVLISLGLFWNRIFASAPVTELASVVYPPEELLRGEADGAIHFPRGRVLAGKEAGLWHALRIELAERANATRYRAHLLRADGGAFDAGTPLCALAADGPELTLADREPGTAAVELAPGHYTCEAWAVVDGLDVPLGRRDFEVVHDADVERALATPPADARGRSALLASMHDRGLLVDARAYARSLPPTPERDAYLRRLPGR